MHLSCSPPTASPEQQQIMQEVSLSTGEQALRLILQHYTPSTIDHYRNDTERILCKLLCVSCSMRTAVLSTCSRAWHLECAATNKAKAKQYAPWIEQYGFLLRSISFTLPRRLRNQSGHLINSPWRYEEGELTKSYAVPSAKRAAVVRILTAAMQDLVAPEADAQKPVAPAVERILTAAMQDLVAPDAQKLMAVAVAAASIPAAATAWTVKAAAGACRSSSRSTGLRLQECYIPCPSPAILAALPSSLTQLQLGALYQDDKALPNLRSPATCEPWLSAAALSHLTAVKKLKLVGNKCPDLMWSQKRLDWAGKSLISGKGLLQIISALPQLSQLYVEPPHFIDSADIPNELEVFMKLPRLDP